jgi:methionyl aminopeptidase
VGPPRSVPDAIVKPDWAATGYPEEEMRSRAQHTIPVRTPKQVKQFTAACRLGREILDAAHRVIKPGVTTDEIDRVRTYSDERQGYIMLRLFPCKRDVCTINARV